MEYFDHIDADTVEEAIRLLKRHKRKAKIIAGGTDLLGILKDRSLPEYPEKLINIKTVGELNNISQPKGGLKIGPLVKVSKIANNPVIMSKYRVLAEAAKMVATPEIRNIATIGGNLCQDVRCWYYRYPRQLGGPVRCRRKDQSSPCYALTGDNRYHAIMGVDKCIAVCPSDIAVALSALNANLVITGFNGRRTIPVSDFYKTINNDLKPGEIITEIQIPDIADNNRQSFIKYTLREPVDFAIVSIACVKQFENDIVSSASIYLGAVAASPFRASIAEDVIKGKSINETIAQQAADAQLADVKVRGQSAYKLEIARNLLKQAILY